jgi:hypothetical protein
MVLVGCEHILQRWSSPKIAGCGSDNSGAGILAPPMRQIAAPLGRISEKGGETGAFGAKFVKK